VLDKQKKRFRVRSLLYYEIFSSFFKLHVAPLEVASKTKLEHKEIKVPYIKKQRAKHKENRAPHTNLMKQGT
jgi:hypothetical protein